MTDSIELGPGKNLRTGSLVWADTAHPPLGTHALKQSLSVDVAIVGASISGAFMAHALAARFEKVVVLDRREPGLGSTHASTAMLQFEIDTPLTDLADQIGGANAAQAWRRSWRATQALSRMVRDEGSAGSPPRGHRVRILKRPRVESAFRHRSHRRDPVAWRGGGRSGGVVARPAAAGAP